MRAIKGFENYMITKDGNVFSKHVRRYIKARVISSGYKRPRSGSIRKA